MDGLASGGRERCPPDADRSDGYGHLALLSRSPVVGKTRPVLDCEAGLPLLSGLVIPLAFSSGKLFFPEKWRRVAVGGGAWRPLVLLPITRRAPTSNPMLPFLLCATRNLSQPVNIFLENILRLPAP